MRSIKKSLLLYTGLVGVMFYGGAVQAAGASTEMLSMNCNGCHGVDGVSQGPATPSIAGLTEEYLTLSMMDYKKGTRSATIMGKIANGYSDDEIKAMAKYFSSKKYASLDQKVDKKMAAEGKKLAKRYCNSCHEKYGKLADGIGVLAGQPMPYLDYTIADFMTGTRPMEDSKKQKMDQLVRDAGEKGFQSVIHFYGSLR